MYVEWYAHCTASGVSVAVYVRTCKAESHKGGEWALILRGTAYEAAMRMRPKRSAVCCYEAVFTLWFSLHVEA